VTIFPPYFVAGAIFSGFAMVLTLLIPVRRIYRLEEVVTESHLNSLGKMLLVTGWVVIYAYIIESWSAWYSGQGPEIYQFFVARPAGPNAFVFWIQQICNVAVPQLLWWRKVRTSTAALWIISILINVGMWAERFVIIVMSLEREYLPSAWYGYRATYVDWGILIGTISFFLLLFLLFLRLFPFIPVAEVKELKHELEHEEGR
jgi:molybdopterin-containing oxidoreductase family membrane subunit